MVIDKYLRNKTRKKGSRGAEGKKGGRGIEMCILYNVHLKHRRGIQKYEYKINLVHSTRHLYVQTPVEG